MMHGDRSRGPPPYHPGWGGGLARKLLVLEKENTGCGHGPWNKQPTGGSEHILFQTHGTTLHFLYSLPMSLHG